jgi:hypothetical protein
MISVSEEDAGSRLARIQGDMDMDMDTNTLLIIVVVIFLLGGFGFYGRGRWY